MHPQSGKLLNFADGTTLTGVILNEDKTLCRWEINHFLTGCRKNNLELNTEDRGDQGLSKNASLTRSKNHIVAMTMMHGKLSMNIRNGNY